MSKYSNLKPAETNHISGNHGKDEAASGNHGKDEAASVCLNPFVGGPLGFPLLTPRWSLKWSGPGHPGTHQIQPGLLGVSKTWSNMELTRGFSFSFTTLRRDRAPPRKTTMDHSWLPGLLGLGFQGSGRFHVEKWLWSKPVRDPILGVLVNSPPILEPILVVGLNRMFTGG